MKRTSIEAGRVYENKYGLQRKVEKVSKRPHFIDGHVVTYRIVKGRECGAERYCTMRAFSKWVQKEVSL